MTSTDNPPMIVFIGPGLSSFQQLAAVAVKQGIDVAWIGYPYSMLRRAHARFFVPKVATASDVGELVDRLQRLGVHRIVDVQASEYVLADVVRAARAAGLPGPVVADLAERLRLSDKLVMSQLLAARGIPVPAALDGATVPTHQAVERLGLPIVVKGRVSAGGTAVHLADSLARATWAAKQVEPFGGVMYEQFVAGETVSYASSSRDGEVLHDMAYRTQRIGHVEQAPPDRIVTLDDAAVMATGRATTRAVARSGLLNVNLIRAEDGTARVHDVNIRPWGTLLALRGTGIDFVDDYLGVHGLAPLATAAPVMVAVNQEFDVFPSAALGLAEIDLIAALLLFASQVPVYARWAGAQYVAAETVRSAGIMGRSLLRRARSAGR